MPEDSLVPISLDGYIAFFAALAVIIGALYWSLRIRERKARKQYFGKFKSSDLRMSPYQIGLIFRVIGQNENKVSIVPIWNGKSPISDGKVLPVDPSQLIPFDETRFF